MKTKEKQINEWLQKVDYELFEDGVQVSSLTSNMDMDDVEIIITAESSDLESLNEILLPHIADYKNTTIGLIHDYAIIDLIPILEDCNIDVLKALHYEEYS